MGERRDPQPGPGSGKPALAAVVRLSPLQEAWGRFVEHATRCEICRSVDTDPCRTAGSLYRAFEEMSTDAFRRLGGEAG
jgi:hypothetical protein